MSMLSNLDLVRRVPLFSTLSDEQAAQVAEAVVKRRFKRGQTIVEQGQRTDTLFILLNGRARVIMTRGNREVILASLHPGDHIGEMSMIDNAPHSATVRADIQTDTLTLSRDAFMQCLPDGSSIAYAIMYGLVQRLRQADLARMVGASREMVSRVIRGLEESNFIRQQKDGTILIVSRDRL